MKIISQASLALGTGLFFNAFSGFAQVPAGVAGSTVTVPGPSDAYTILSDTLQRHCEAGSKTKLTLAKYKKDLISSDRSLTRANEDLGQHALCSALAAKNPGLCDDLNNIFYSNRQGAAPPARSRLDCLVYYHVFRSVLAAKEAKTEEAVKQCREFLRYWEESFGLYGNSMGTNDKKFHEFLAKTKDTKGGYCPNLVGQFMEGDAKTACAEIFKATGGGWECERMVSFLNGQPKACEPSEEGYAQQNCQSLAALLSIHRGKGDAGCQDLPLCRAALSSSTKPCQSYMESSTQDFCKVWSSSRIDEMATRKTVDAEVKAIIKALEKKRGKQ